MGNPVTEGDRLIESGSVEQVLLPKTLFLNRQLQFNRELSWLEFNGRVLEEALDRSLPLLERLNFLSIFSTNLDEFFMIRVAGLKQQLEAGVIELSPDGMTPGAQLREISERLRPMIAQQMRCVNEELVPGLAERSVIVTPFRALSDRERRSLNGYFQEQVFPVLTPLAVDPAHPFPIISSQSLNLGVMVGPTAGSGDAGPARFARIKVPPIVPRLVPVADSSTEFTLLEDLIAANIDALFPGMDVGESHVFRVTRGADLDIKDDEADDLLRMLEQELRKRRFGSAVRLETASSMPGEMVRYLAASMGLAAEDVYTIEGPLDVPGLMDLYNIDKPELRFKPFVASMPKPLSTGHSVFDVLKQQDLLVHHPYESFSAIVDFISAAASDPDVLAIKTTLYRTGHDSPVVRALTEASEQGKQVAVLVELKARFDEENNITWARQLERAGVHVVYGLLGLKTHCKLALVVRREGDGLRRYVHISTGNYNPTTARVYEDVGLLTTSEMISTDASDLFNFLTGFSQQGQSKRLIVAPGNLRDRLIELIDREIAHQSASRAARIVIKVNQLTDTKIMRALYKASQAGVDIQLIVRGICTLKPGVPGLSDTIQVRSIVGRFLEHSRIFYFANGGDEDVYIGSADLMMRNMDRRVELLTPIDDPKLKKRLKENVLEAYLRDTVKARRLLSDGTYERIKPAPGAAPFDCQLSFSQFLHAAD
ncbi:MAG TPA: polyphosphate kinase 1 [Blastocatellia bacterium]|nr:polyphosphate kinase 1 [Blastocatellia bacterium]